LTPYFFVNLLVPVFLPLRAGADENVTIQEKCPKFIPTQEVILRRRIQWFQLITAQHRNKNQIAALVRPENTLPIYSTWRRFYLSWDLSGNPLLLL
jgi:hypothetical protein